MLSPQQDEEEKKTQGKGVTITSKQFNQLKYMLHKNFSGQTKHDKGSANGTYVKFDCIDFSLMLRNADIKQFAREAIFTHQ